MRGALLALGALVLGGCASAPDPLRVAIDVNNLSVAGLAEARAAHEERLTASYRQKLALCPTDPAAARAVCRRDAKIATLAEFSEERAKLGAITLSERLAADALMAAKQCRTDGLACEADKLREADAALAEVRAWLDSGAL